MLIARSQLVVESSDTSDTNDSNAALNYSESNRGNVFSGCYHYVAIKEIN